MDKETVMPRLAFAPAARPGRATFASRLAARLSMLWSALQRERRLLATIRSLHGLNDRTLSDIGLRREDIEDVVRARYRDR